MLWLSEETEELAIQDSLCTDTQLQFTATNVTCKGLTVARKRPIIHGDRKSMRYSIYFSHGENNVLVAIIAVWTTDSYFNIITYFFQASLSFTIRLQLSSLRPCAQMLGQYGRPSCSFASRSRIQHTCSTIISSISIAPARSQCNY